MEGELWRQVYGLAKRLSKGKGVVRGKFLDLEVAAVHLWSVLHDRPVKWACDRRNWRGSCPMKRLPSRATMSRRLRSAGVQQLLRNLEQALVKRGRRSWCRFIDGKPLPVSGHSQAQGVGYGRTTCGMGKGYKFHGVFDEFQGFVAWRIKPMNANESKVAHELIGELSKGGYLVGDNQFDQNPAYQAAGERAIQLLAPRRKNVKGLGHIRHSPHRLRAIDVLISPLRSVAPRGSPLDRINLLPIHRIGVRSSAAAELGPHPKAGRKLGPRQADLLHRLPSTAKDLRRLMQLPRKPLAIHCRPFGSPNDTPHRDLSSRFVSPSRSPASCAGASRGSSRSSRYRIWL
jgi:hypothetical protein